MLTLLMEWVEDFVRVFRTLNRRLAKLYVGDPGRDTMGRNGMAGLSIIGRQ